ncbi:MAG: hypothetical protein AB1782_12510 [Cyanobacteriota bacterium]
MEESILITPSLTPSLSIVGIFIPLVLFGIAISIILTLFKMKEHTIGSVVVLILITITLGGVGSYFLYLYLGDVLVKPEVIITNQEIIFKKESSWYKDLVTYDISDSALEINCENDSIILDEKSKTYVETPFEYKSCTLTDIAQTTELKSDWWSYEDLFKLKTEVTKKLRILNNNENDDIEPVKSSQNSENPNFSIFDIQTKAEKETKSDSNSQDQPTSDFYKLESDVKKMYKYTQEEKENE